MNGRHRSTAYFTESGGASPVSFSRTISPSTSAIGTSAFTARLRESPLGQALFEPGGQVVCDAFHGDRADGFDARLLGGFEHAPPRRPIAA